MDDLTDPNYLDLCVVPSTAEELEEIRREANPPPVAYIWSQELQDAADKLPANLGRSSMVHELVKSFDLLEVNPGSPSTDESVENKPPSDKESDVGEVTKSTERAIIVSPDLGLGSAEALQRYHDADYVDYLMKPYVEDESDDDEVSQSSTSSSDSSSHRPAKRQRRDIHGLEHDCPKFAELPTYASMIAAATQTACRLLANGTHRTAICWDGGRHHAMRNRASGFCYVADIVLGIMLLRKEGIGRVGYNGRRHRPRIMYIDLDLHNGDGVAQAFLSPTKYPNDHQASDQTIETARKRLPKAPQVLTLSMHHHSPGFFPPHTSHSGFPDPDTPNPFTLSIPLKAYAGRRTYWRAWEMVELARVAYRPDYVVLQLGMDGLPGDRVGQYGAWSLGGDGGMEWCLQKAKNWRVPLCVLGGGGYDHPNTARAWAMATSALLDRPLDHAADIPPHDHYEAYQPSFTLEVPPSHAPDENDDDYLDDLIEPFSIIAGRINRILMCHGE